MDPKEIAHFFRPPQWATGYISLEDATFLDQMVQRCQPANVVEVGVASGCSSALLLRSLAAIGGAGRLHSFDLAEQCYFDPSKRVGAAVTELVPELEEEWTLHTGCVASDAAMLFKSKSVALAFIDADHRHPWPALDLWALLPALAPGGWVALHDIALARVTEWKIFGPEILFEQWPGEKARSEGRSNIGAIRLPESEDQSRAWISDILRTAWETGVDPAILDRLNVPSVARHAQISLRTLPKGLDQRLADLRMHGRELVIWGAGGSGRLCLDLLINVGIRPDAFVDRDESKQDRRISGVPVWAVKKLSLCEPRPFVLVASMYEAEIACELHAAGFHESSDFINFRFDETFERSGDVAATGEEQRHLLGMTTVEEQDFLFDYASRHYANIGAIVDLGSWLGSTTIPLARGLEAAGVPEDRCVQSYDTFVWQTWMDQYAEGLSTRFQAGESFLVEFQRSLGRFSTRVQVYPGDLMKLGWKGGDIEFLVIDAMKSWALCRAINSTFLTSLIPGGGLFLHQDFKFWGCPWIHLTMYRMREHWKLEQDLTQSPGTVFRLLTRPDAAVLVGQSDPKSFSKNEVDAAYAFWFSRLAGPFVIQLRYARLLALAEIGEIEAVVSEIACLGDEDCILPKPIVDHLGSRVPKLKHVLEEAESWEISVRRAVAEGRPVWVWGGGSGGAGFLRRNPQLRSVAEGVMDSDPSKVGMLIEGLPVEDPTSVLGLAQTGNAPFVVIATSFVSEVVGLLKTRGLVKQRDYCLGSLL